MFAAPASRTRDLLELIVGYGLIVGIIWSPEPWQRVLAPFALLLTLMVVVIRHPTMDELGLTWRGAARSLWLVPAAIALYSLSVFIAAKCGTQHPLYKGDLKHSGGYVLWTIYQQFLLQDYFMDRLLRLGATVPSAVAIAGTLFAAAHLPSPWLSAATLAWGMISCALFRRYRSVWVLGLIQGLLGLCFAICVPDAAHHHLRVGLGYLRYRPTPLP